MENERSGDRGERSSGGGGRGGHGKHGGHGKRDGHRHGGGGRHGRKDDRHGRTGSYQEHDAAPSIPDEPSPDMWFMGIDRRTVEEIVATDANSLARIGLSAEQAAAALEKILSAAVAAMGGEITLAGGRLKAVCHESMGKIVCPVGSCGLFPKGVVELTDSQAGKTYRISPLLIHMIGQHKFFQGRGCDFRIEPEDVAQLAKLVE